MKLIALASVCFGIAALGSAQSTPAGPDLSVNASDSISLRKISLLGLWTVRINKLENKTIKLSFEKDSKFRFCCSGAKSEGTYEIRNGKIILSYLKVDGDPVEFEMKKSLPVAIDGLSFEVDSYHYERASDDVKF